MRSSRVLALAAAVSLALSACGAASGGAQTDTGTAAPSAAGKVPAGLETFYSQELEWTGCGADGMTCATVQVPLDYADPGGEAIELSVSRTAAPENGRGALFVNPGGPGGEASTLVENAPLMFSTDLLEQYQIVGVDPRGVGESTPVTCLEPAELDTVLASTFDLTTPGGRDQYAAQAAQVAAGCVEHSGIDLLAHVSTEEAARDHDVVRALLGEEEFDYLGFSYGTFLGGMYAHLFPGTVGRMVLDGGLDPTLSTHEVVLGQATGFEDSLAAWAAACTQGTDCPVQGTPQEAVGQVQRFLEEVGETPLPTDSGRSLTGSLATMGVITGLYSELSWPAVTSALNMAMTGDGTDLLALADFGSGRRPDGSYESNSSEALWAVNCRDFVASSDPAQWDADAAELTAAAPVFGPALAYSDVLCDVWPDEASASEQVDPLVATDAPPMLVVGTTNDPATPYAWSESLAAQFGNDSRLLTVEGYGHTAYSALADGCVRGAVDGFLLDGQLPEEGTTC